MEEEEGGVQLGICSSNLEVGRVGSGLEEEAWEWEGVTEEREEEGSTLD